MLAVKLSVHVEDTAFEVDDALSFGLSVGLFGGEFEVEVSSLFQFQYLLFKTVESDAEATDKLEGFFGGCF